MAKVINLKDSGRKNRIDIAKENKDKRRSLIGKKKGSRRFSKKFKKVLLVLVGIFLLAAVIGSVEIVAYVQKINKDLPSVDSPFGPNPLSTTIYDRNSETDVSQGTLLYKMFGDANADPVNIDNIPETVKWSFLAAEDRTFYTNKGFNIQTLVICGIKSGINKITGKGTACGGSTITQQLIKLRVLGSKVTVDRKIRELLMSTKIDQTYSKDEILQMYLTVTSYGSNITGVETASKFYFGKESKDLSLAQSAILAAIINDPNYLAPTVPLDGDIERAQADVKERQGYILDQLEEHMNEINAQIKKNHNDQNMADVFTKELIQAARDEEITYSDPIATDKKAGSFVDYVINQLETQNYKDGEEPFTVDDLQTGGYKIITTLDYGQQQIAEAEVAHGGNDYTNWNVNNAAIMTVDPTNGEILVMAGSKSYTGESEGCDEDGANCKYNPQVNVLTSLNEPGSTNKPLAYTLAYQDGKLFGGSNLPDIAIEFPELNYTPKDWDGSYLGDTLSAKDALRQSRNIPALQVITLIGIESYLNAAQKLGYTTYQADQVGPSIVLGGASVKYTEHLGAYAAFANEGNYTPLNPILRIEDSDGKVIYEAKPQSTQVLTPQSVYLLNQDLYDLQSVTAYSGIPLSCKTGTTEANTDALQICWNSTQVTLAWVGNNNNDPLDQTYGYPIYVVQPWLLDYFAKINSAPYYSGKDQTIKRPGYVYQGNGCQSGSTTCVGGQTDWMIQDKPASSYMEKKVFTVCTDQTDRLARDIDIATGFSKQVEITRKIMPASRWQSNLDSYVKNKGGLNTYPTEPCNVDRTGGQTGPYFSLQSPTNNITVTNSVNVKGSVISTSGNINSLTFKLNNQSLGSTATYVNMDLNLDITGLSLAPGTYQFVATATDTAGYTNSYTVNVKVQNGYSSTWNNPSSAQVAHAVTLKIHINGSNIQTVQIKDTNGNVIGSALGNSSGDYSISWLPTTAGNYVFTATATITGGGTYTSDQSPTLTVSP